MSNSKNSSKKTTTKYNKKKTKKIESDKTEKKSYTVKKKVSNNDTKKVPIIKFESLSDNLKPSKIKDEDNKIKKARESKKKEEVKEVKEVKEETKPEVIENNSNSSNNLNEQIQSFVSILFTVVIFIALVLLIIILYNNYFKKEKEIDYNKVCSDFIEKDYGITRDMITNFVRNGRAIIYNYDNFEKSKLTNDDLIKFASYFIWSEDLEYEECSDDDSRCLVSKMEMDINTLKDQFKNYLDIKDVKIEYPTEFSDDDKTRLYQDGDKVVLTFSEFEYQSLRHNIVATNIKEDKVIVTFALEKLVDDTNIYSYVGYKTVELKYHDKNFSIESIKTNLKEN